MGAAWVSKSTCPGWNQRPPFPRFAPHVRLVLDAEGWRTVCAQRYSWPQDYCDDSAVCSPLSRLQARYGGTDGADLGEARKIEPIACQTSRPKDRLRSQSCPYSLRLPDRPICRTGAVVRSDFIMTEFTPAGLTCANSRKWITIVSRPDHRRPAGYLPLDIICSITVACA